MRHLLLQSLDDCTRATEQLKTPEAINFIESAVSLIVDCFQKGNKIILAGNGGSLCDAMHFAEELTGFFRQNRPALPAIALSDPGHMSCVGNDQGFDSVFSRGIEAYGKPNDVFIALTTSGNSKNLVNAVKTARSLDLKTISFLGKGGGNLKNLSDLEWIVNGFTTSDRIQEAHMAAIHVIIEFIEYKLFPKIIINDKISVPDLINMN